MSSDIDTRSGWPDELKTLLARHPRETWASRDSPMAQFWLERHDEFRRYAAELTSMAQAYQNQRKSLEELTSWTAPRLQAFLGSLHGHHQIEDFHYFPVFREANKELASGFDVLARDHERLHHAIAEIIDAFNALVTAARSANAANADTSRRIADRYIELSDIMSRRLTRHLDDEEDLIIPIMLA